MSPLQRIIHRGTFLLCPILLFLIGLYYLVQLVGPSPWQEWLEWHTLAYFRNGSTLATWARWAWALLLILLPLFMLLLYFQRMWTSSILVLKTDSGQPLKIRESAVNRYIHDRLLALPYIRSARVRSKAKGGGLALFVRIWVSSHQPLNNVQERTLNRITEDAQQGFGISKILPPDLQFESVQTSKENEVEQLSTTEDPAATSPFATYSAETRSMKQSLEEEEPSTSAATAADQPASTETERDTTPGNRWGS